MHENDGKEQDAEQKDSIGELRLGFKTWVVSKSNIHQSSLVLPAGQSCYLQQLFSLVRRKKMLFGNTGEIKSTNTEVKGKKSSAALKQGCTYIKV